MKLVKKINTLCISFFVAVLYVFVIGIAWIIHQTTKHTQAQTESYWHIPNLKKLPKHYFSSPY